MIVDVSGLWSRTARLAAEKVPPERLLESLRAMLAEDRTDTGKPAGHRQPSVGILPFRG